MRFILTIVFLFLVNIIYGQNILLPEFKGADGSIGFVINDSARNQYIIGGNFNRIGGNYIDGGAPVSLDTTVANPIPLNWPSPGGSSIEVSISDGFGGWYVGGQFTTMGGLVRKGLAHISNTGQVTVFQANTVGGTVRSIALDLSANTLYVGGEFTSINGITRDNVAAVNATTGALLPWNPGAPGYSVNDIEVSPTAVFISSGDGWDSYVRQLDKVTGAIQRAWSYDLADMVYHNNKLYVAGDISGRGGLACIDVTTGQLTTWDPMAGVGSGAVEQMVVCGNNLYVCGEFIGIRSYLAAFNITTGAITTWQPVTDSDVYAITSTGHSIIITTGIFTTVNNIPRNGIAELDTLEGDVTGWYPTGTGYESAWKISADCRNVFLNGPEHTAGGIKRTKLAAVNKCTGEILPFAPEINGVVACGYVSGDTLYIGGNFTRVNGQTRTRFAAFNMADGSLLPTTVGFDDYVYTIAKKGNTLLIGGDFTHATIAVGSNFNYYTRNNFAAIGSAGNMVYGTTLNANQTIRSIIVHGNKAYLGGQFTTINNITRNRLAAIDLNTYTLSTWNPNANDAVFNILAHGDKIWASGYFDTINNIARNVIVEIDTATALPTAWDISINAPVAEMAIVDSTLYIAGTFDTINGTPRKNLAALSANTATLFNWQQFNSIGQDWPTLYADEKMVMVYPFTNISVNNNFITKFAALSPATHATLPNAPNSILPIVVSKISNGDSVLVSYVSNINFNGGNIFTAQLSDASGSFANATTIGTLPSTSAGIISCKIPNNTTAGSNYLIRIKSTSPQVTDTTSCPITVSQVLVQPQNFTQQTDTVCAGQTGVVYQIGGNGNFVWHFTGNGATITPLGNTATINFSSTATSGILQVYYTTGCAAFGSSQNIPITVLPLPAIPTGLATSNTTNNGFTANWNAVAGATSYTITVASDNAFANIVTQYNNFNVGNVTTFSVTNLPLAPTYYYKITAINNCGAGTASSTATALLNTITTVFSTPTLCLNLGQDTIIVNYTITGTYLPGNIFSVQLSSISGQFTNPTIIGQYAGTTNTPIVCTLPLNLTSSGSYRVRVVSTMPAITGSQNSTGVPITHAPNNPALAIAASNTLQTEFKARWNSASLTSNYYLDVATDTSFTNILPNYNGLDVGNVTSYTVLGLQHNTNYYYRVKNANLCGVGGYSNTILVTTQNYSINTNVSVLQLCNTTNTPLNVSYSLYGTFPQNTVFAAQLSDASGSFANATNIGQGVSSPIACVIPSTIPAGNGYRIRVISTIPAITGNQNSSNITITQAPPQLTGFVVAQPNVCQGQSNVLYTVDAINGTYSWLYTGTGATIINNGDSALLNFSAQATGGNLTASATNLCGTSTPVLYTVTITPPPPAVNFITSQTTVCAGQQDVLYTASNFNTFYNWTYTGTGATLNSNGDSLYVDFDANATGGVLGINTYTTCGESDTATITIIVEQTPNTPITLAATTISQQQFTANWQATANTDYYLLDVATDAAFINLLPSYSGLNVGNVTSYEIANLQANTVYYYRVKAINMCGENSYSNTTLANTLINSITHTANENISVYAANNTVYIAPAKDILAYRLYNALGQQIVIYNATTTGNTLVLNAETAPGIYYIIIDTLKGSMYKKFVVQ